MSTVGGRRWRNAPKLAAYLAALRSGRPPARELEELDPATRTGERLMLGLRLDTPLPLAEVETALAAGSLRRMEYLGLAEVREGGLVLTPRGRFLGGAVTAELLA